MYLNSTPWGRRRDYLQSQMPLPQGTSQYQYVVIPHLHCGYARDSGAWPGVHLQSMTAVPPVYTQAVPPTVPVHTPVHGCGTYLCVYCPILHMLIAAIQVRPDDEVTAQVEFESVYQLTTV